MSRAQRSIFNGFDNYINQAYTSKELDMPQIKGCTNRSLSSQNSADSKSPKAKEQPSSQLDYPNGVLPKRFKSFIERS